MAARQPHPSHKIRKKLLLTVNTNKDKARNMKYSIAAILVASMGRYSNAGRARAQPAGPRRTLMKMKERRHDQTHSSNVQGHGHLDRIPTNVGSHGGARTGLRGGPRTGTSNLRAHGPHGGTRTTHGDKPIPLKVKGAPSQHSASGMEISIVGGEESNVADFPYFGTSFSVSNEQQRCR